MKKGKGCKTFSAHNEWKEQCTRPLRRVHCQSAEKIFSAPYTAGHAGGFDCGRNGVRRNTGRKEQVNVMPPNGLHGSFVRENKQSQELCICMDEYSDDIKSEHWMMLTDMVG